MPNKIGRFFQSLGNSQNIIMNRIRNFHEFFNQSRQVLFVHFFFSLLSKLSDGLKKNHDNTKYLYE